MNVAELNDAERASFDEIVAQGYTEEQALQAVADARADLEQAPQRIPWFALAETLRAFRATRRVNRLAQQTFVRGPFVSSRAIRRADGDRGHTHGLGAKATSVKTKKRKNA